VFLRKKQVAALSVLLIVTVMAPTQEIAFAKTPKPTQAQIDAAKAVEVAKQKAAAAAQSKLNSATQTLRQLTSIAQIAAAKYQKAQADLVIAIQQAHAAAAHYALAQAAVNQANKTIGRMAQNAYMMGSGFTDLESVLHATGPQDLMDRLSALDSLGANNSAALSRFKAASIVAQAAKIEADRTKVAQAVATEKVAATKKAADESKALQQNEVNRLMAIQNQLSKELASAHNVRITLEQQRQLALLEEASAAKAAVTPNQYKVWPNKNYKGRTTIRSTDSIRSAAVAYASKQVLAHKPYVWGAQGPSSFDCSGLVYAAYKSAGLGYPNWSRLNAALYFVDTQRVPLSQLVPGDLLFYSYDGSIQNIHHITIYAGNGKMWEANSTKTGLKFSDMYSIKGLMPSGGRV